MVGQVQKNLQMLFNAQALNIYAGAALGFYGSRIAQEFLVKPLITAASGEGPATGLRNPDNYKEATDLLWGAILLISPMNQNMKMGVVAGVGLSVIDHLLARPAFASRPKCRARS